MLQEELLLHFRTVKWFDYEVQIIFVQGLACNVTDANGCVSTFTTNVSQPLAISVNTSNISNVDCYGASNGSATVFATGVTGSYSYLWSNGQTTAQANGLSAGIYTCSVTDASGCNQGLLRINITPTFCNLCINNEMM